MKTLLFALAGYLALVWSGTGLEVEEFHALRLPEKSVELVPGPNDPVIVKLTGRLLERQHYLRMRFDDEVSSKFLDRYLDALDSLHMYFTQEDLAEFEKYRTELDDLCLDAGDTTPARVIFKRFLKRMRQQYDYVTNLLATEKFEFTGHDRYVVNRRKLPRPKDLDEARKLWRQRLRHEYLLEKLNIGQPEKIRDAILDELKKPEGERDLLKALKGKVGDEKATNLVALVQSMKAQSPEAIGQAVLKKLEKDNAAEIVKTITRRYTRVLRYLMEYDNDDVLQVYLTALCHVYDPHTDYMGRAQLEDFSIGMKLSLFGIGAVLTSVDGICTIKELKPGPAQRSGQVKPNDKIVAVAQGDGEPVDVVDMPLRKVVDLIRGPKGTEVRLTIIPADAPDPSVRKVVSLIREEIKLEDQEAKARIYELPDGPRKPMRIGVIDLPSFYSSFELAGERGQSTPKSTTTDVAKLLRKLVKEDVSGVILDLRRNGGGSLEEAINLTGLFIKEGPVVMVKDGDGRVAVDSDEDPSVVYNGPLIVLTSRFSASASEILAGALQDYGRALIVGDTSTHGKGTVQSLIQLAAILRHYTGFIPTNNPGALKITIRKFYLPSGSSTQLRGVVPDIVLPSLNNVYEVGEAHLDNALPWDRIDPAPYEKVDVIEPYLSELKRRSELRVAKDPDFQFIREEIRRYEKRKAEEGVILNEAERRREKQEADERRKARRKELAARPKPEEKVYEIKLKDVTLPGLPAPLEATNTLAQSSAAEAHAAAGVESDTDEDESIPEVDPALEEAKRIMLDLVELMLARKHSLTAIVPDELVQP